MRTVHISHSSNAHDLRVFVADDSQLIRVRIVALVAGCPGVRCVGWSDSVNGTLDGIRDTAPHGLILDLQLIGGSGFDVLQAVRESDRALHVVVCTNWATDQHRAACRAAGADCVLDKSTEFAELRNVVLQWAQARVPAQQSRIH